MPRLNPELRIFLENRFEMNKEKVKTLIADNIGLIDYLKINNQHCYKFVYNKATGDYIFTAYEKRQPEFKYVKQWVQHELLLMKM